MSKRKTYTTKTRVEILKYIKANSDRAISASDIIEHMKEIGSSVNQTTVYRYLDKLILENIIVKYADVSGEKSVYQYIQNKNDCVNHLHLKCKECGKLIHMDCEFIDDFSKHLLNNHDFQIQYEGNMLYGICKDCEYNKKHK